MSVKIFHTGDIHLGMTFGGYPDNIRADLIEARYKTLAKMINLANEENCHLFIIAGDLFDKTKINKKDIIRTKEILTRFSGHCVLVLPGNHDYEDGMVSLWEIFRKNVAEKIILLNEKTPYDLKGFGLDILIYPAPCHKKHSSEHNLAWIKKTEHKSLANWHIGIAHGTLKELSVDMDQNYFPMTKKELEEMRMDLWLLGHSHFSFPEADVVKHHQIFNAGTPEPDGMDCKHEGEAWILSLEEGKKIFGRKVSVGSYLFKDQTRTIEGASCFEKLLTDFATTTKNVILRLKLKGQLDKELFKEKEEYYRQLKNQYHYLIVDDSQLKIKITADMIRDEFLENSLPHQLISSLLAEKEDEAAQLAYELIREVQQN